MSKSSETQTGLFPALLKYWRGRRGLSQLDLAIASEVSARHISFLETQRARPSADMVLVLGAALEVPLRKQNEMLAAAGFKKRFDESGFDEILHGAIGHVVDRMLSHHAPFPMVVMDSCYNAIRMNAGGVGLMKAFVADPAALPEGKPNLMKSLFDPKLARPFVGDWERIARQLVSRVHRESLMRPDSVELADLLKSLLAYPDVPSAWRKPDFSVEPTPAFTLKLSRGDLSVSFLTTVTVFSTPSKVALEELQIESYFPLDDQTASACEQLCSEATSSS